MTKKLLTSTLPETVKLDRLRYALSYSVLCVCTYLSVLMYVCNVLKLALFKLARPSVIVHTVGG